MRAIQQISLSSTNQSDNQIWRGTANGLFWVRSAYYLAKEMEDRAKAESSKGRHCSEVWKRLWKLKVPNAEKNFIWRACHNILPTKDNLMRRKVVKDPKCPICELEIETTFHILWECPSAMDEWGVSSTFFQKSSRNGPAFIHVTEKVFQKCEEEDIKLFVGLARKLWFRRNEVVHGGLFTHPNDLVQSSIHDYEEATKKEEMGRVVEWDKEIEAWKAPQTGTFKTNWDAAINQNDGRIGLGFIVRDHLERVHICS